MTSKIYLVWVEGHGERTFKTFREAMEYADWCIQKEPSLSVNICDMPSCYHEWLWTGTAEKKRHGYDFEQWRQSRGE